MTGRSSGRAVHAGYAAGRAREPPATGIFISAVAVPLLLFSGWKGGNLVYRHATGVRDGTDV